jgi:hypothetical protein
MMYVLDHKVPLRVPDLWQVFYVLVHVVLEGFDILNGVEVIILYNDGVVMVLIAVKVGNRFG